MATIANILRSIGSIYKSFEIRILTVETTVFPEVHTMAIYFSLDEPLPATERENHKEVGFYHYTLSMKHWDVFSRELSHGEVNVSGTKVANFSPMDVTGIGAFMRPYPGRAIQNQWPVALGESHFQIKAPTPDLNAAAMAFGYAHFAALADYKLGIYGQSNQPIFLIVAPIPAKIDEVKLTDKRSVEVRISFHQKIIPLKVLIEQLGETQGWKPQPLLPAQLFQIKEGATTISEKTIEVNNLDLSNSDTQIKVGLNHPGIGLEVAFYYSILRKLIIESNLITSPLLSAFLLFMKKEEFVRLLEHPQIPTPRPKNNGRDNFEEAIGKLLTLGGFPTLELGEYEHFLDSKHRQGSADLLSYDRESGTLFVVSCKSGITDRAFIDQIITTKNLIRENIPNSKITEVVPLVFTNTDAPLISGEAKKFGVHVFDKEDIKILFETIQTRLLTAKDLMKDST